MVRITKTMQTKHLESLSPWIKEFRNAASSIPLPLLPQKLATFPSRWPFPRGDLYHWIPLLNRFDEIYEQFAKIYKLDEGPQTVDFACTLLLSKAGESDEQQQNGHNLESLGFSQEGDRELVESILSFTVVLLQNCGNRSIYGSSANLNHFLNSTSLSLLEGTLRLGSELGQRYQAALKRTNIPGRQISHAMLINHYNIDLERVQQLSLPFSKTITTATESTQPTTPATPSAKGKEKAYFSIPTTPSKGPSITVHANDLVSMVKGGPGVGGTPKSARNGVDVAVHQDSWEDWGDVKITYYPKPVAESESTNQALRPPNPSSPSVPVTPTPVRRSSNLGPHGQRANRQSISEDTSPSLPRSSTFPSDDATRPSHKVIEISASTLKSTGIHTLLREHAPGLPQELQYELLTKLRVASALTSSVETRRQLLSVRLLAITNLSYIHLLESTFLETVMKQDSDEPRRMQLVYQLAELVHPPPDGEIPVPRPIQTLAFACLDGLCNHQSKFTDVCAALNTNVNHGVLLYVVRKAVAGMNQEDNGDRLDGEDEWREALFSLLSNLAINPRTGSEMVTAGLIPILVEVLTLRSSIAERYHPMILTFLDAIMYSTRDAFQTLVSAEGLDTVSNLIVYEVNSAKANAAAGKGMRPEYRSGSVDYQIPFFQQQTLKWLFKFIHHMMSSAGVYGGNFDRLLRNLIDSSQLLGSLRQIIGDARCFGSNVWTNAVSILNDFINNEPTSFAVIAEAGLSRGLLEAITGRPVVMPVDGPKEETRPEPVNTDDDERSPSPPSDRDDSEDERYNLHDLSSIELPRNGPLARGILPTSESINIIPQAFGAICLNNAGMKMFQASHALETFFEIFESPEHVKCMESIKDLPSNLGSTFDELVRHHPPLKEAIMTAILNMVARVDQLCMNMAHRENLGAKLWATDSSGKVVVADKEMKVSLVDRSVKGKGKAVDDSDVEMVDADLPSTDAHSNQTTSSDGSSKASTTPYIAAVSTFLSGMFSNSTVRSEFVGKGGLEYVLSLAASRSLPYDFADSNASRSVHQVIAQLAETKAHLVLPSLLKKAQQAADILQPFASFDGNVPFFEPFVKPDAAQSGDVEFLAKGTDFAKAFVNLHSLVASINTCFQASVYNHRSATSIFTMTNVNDYYIKLVRSLGPLLGASLKEEMRLQMSVPDQWKDEARVKDPLPTETGASEPISSAEQPPVTLGSSAQNNPNNLGETVPLSEGDVSQSPNSKKSISKPEQDTPAFKNYQTLRYLLAKMPRTVQPLFQTLGKAVVTKRNPDHFQKQYHFALADALVESILSQFVGFGEASSVDNFDYWRGLLNILNSMLIDESRQNDRPVQTITLIVQSFKDHGGLKTLNDMLKVFAATIQSAPTSLAESLDKSAAAYLKLEFATAGVKQILKIYSQLVNGKNVTEAVQTIGLTSRSDRERGRPDHFSPGQLIVELRMAILPVVRQLWGSDLIEKGDSQISEKLIDVIRLIAAADCEAGAVKRTDKGIKSVPAVRKTFKPSTDGLASLTEDFLPDLAEEALYRCNNNENSAIEYCRLILHNGAFSRNPIPDGDIAPSPESTALPSLQSMVGSLANPSRSTGASTPAEDHAMGGTTAGSDAHATVEQTASSFLEPFSDMAEDSNGIGEDNDAFHAFLNTLHSNDPAAGTSPPPPEETPRKQVTIEDLNEEREAVRDNLIDKCLDAINAHGEVTFEVADLITMVVNKSSDPAGQRKVVGETLVIALMSFAGEEDLRTCGKKVAAYAHLLALMLRDKLFYAAAVSELKENLSTLLSFVKLSPNHSADEPSPWIAHILLIIEMLLSEDEKPQKTKWTIPKDDNDTVEPPILEVSDPTVSKDERSQLLDAILDILPRIGKDESLALAVLRILVILTRTRAVAQAISDKKNIQRVFVMAKQLAGASSTRIQGPLMLILRHIIEDDETIKQIMRAEIKSFLENNRQQRNIDEKHYIRGLAHVAVRNPELFVEVTNEMVKFNRWTYPSADGQSRHHSLMLKEAQSDASRTSEDAVQPTVQATEDLTIQDIKPSTEGPDSEMPDAAKPAVVDHKLPVIENPDGVIHFLLCELLNYRDVEDKDPSVAINTAEKNGVQSNGDTAMGETSPSTDSTTKDPKTAKPATKQEFKAEEHPIYIYRCFILQCLTELLASYNRTKIEFINFKRSAPPQAMTPSKPRSSVVNYLLFDLIPVGTLDHAETTSMRKKMITSAWADSVLTALLCKTGEQPIEKDREPYNSDTEPDLLFVRRFVLENILKAYKEASTSTENLDIKYARMLALADLMNHIMNGKENVGMSDTAVAATSQKQLRRIMFEKGYVAALTASIADIDLNFPSAKRAVKYILRPLKTLTTTAVNLSDLALISDTTGQDEEEIESATSLSEPEDDREETPDLFRNSTLGMFEQGREEDSSSGDDEDDDDEEMYEQEYDDEMDYEEEPGDDEDGISDEDEEIEGMGPIEGLSGDHNLDVEVIMGDDDDDEDDDDSNSDDDEEHDSEDDDAHVEIIDEAGNVQQLAEDDEMGEWESADGDDDDGEEEDYEGQAADQEEEQLHAMEAMGGPLGHLVRALGGNDDAAQDILERMEAEGVDMDEGDDDERVAGEYVEDGDEEEDEDDDDEMDDEDMLFDQYPMDGPGFDGGWQEDVEPPTVVHQRRRGGGFSPFPSLFPGGPRDPLGVPDYRSSRLYRSNPPGGAAPRAADEGINPLLQRNGAASRDGPGRTPAVGSWIQAMGGPGEILDIGLGRPFGHIARHGHALQFHITTSPGHQLPPDLQAMFNMRPSRFEPRRDNTESGSVASFTPQSTAARWLEESKLLFGASALERAADLTTAILSLLVPPAIEADKALKAAEAEKVRKLEEQLKKKQEEERVAREKKEEEERIAREKKEAEEREAAERAAAEALAARGEDAEAAEDDEDEAVEPTSDAMDGVETETPAPAGEQTEESAADRARIMTMMRGIPFDITDLGIDPDFLTELPEDLREEVIMSAVADRRQAAAATGAQPSEIDQEFLDALPDDIRDEIIQQERQERRRREREERQRQAAAASGGAASAEMDAASILATLPPALRSQVLMEQDEETLALLPPELADQARAELRNHPAHGRMPGFATRRVAPPAGDAVPVNAQRPPRRAIVQMLDKPGVATLLRLMFIFQHGSLRTTLNSVLQNVSLNRHNRNEVLSTLLHILQDGSIDMSAVDRSFAHLSLKAKQPKDAQPKTPQPLKKALTGLGPLTTTTLEASPLMVVQQCLSTLVYLNQVNPHIPAFFLTEHDSSGGLKRTLSRKGKSKESKAAKYALNSLLSLLGRDLIMESSTVMETLSSLLNMVTSPLQALQRKQKEAEEEQKTETVNATPSVTDTAPSATSPEATATEQPSAPQLETAASEVTPTADQTPAQPLTIAEGGEPSTSNDAPKPEATKEQEKKQRPITPPVIPEQNLKLVINIFVARECSSKTFRETLSTIKNLSTIPNAKAVFGRELISKAQELGEIILVDLEELLPQIKKASTGTEIQGVALAKFSPGGSDQNKLLRVLTALDHLFDPKREKKDTPESEDQAASSQLVEKQDLLSSLYENPTFGRMWERLSACLSAIRQREHMLNVATILLPLIEALMVVCKNTTLKDAPLAKSQMGKEMMLTSPPPESQMENLFFTFTEEHRKILNDLVRQTPKLMSGTFSLLVKNPKVLEFDNKRNYFSRSIHSKAPNSRQSFPPLQLSVRRDQVFHDSFKSLYFQTGDQMKYGKLSIRFHGEEGVDAGGVTREWFQVLSRQMFDPGYALFIPVSSDRTTFHPNQLSSVNEEHLMFFKFIGRIIGKALYEGRVLDCHFSRAVYKRILGKAVSVKDMESLDPDYYKSLIWMLENDITDIITETFSVDNDKFGVVETIDFIPDGRNIPVTEENKQEYVRLMVEWKLTGSVKEQLDEFLKGFHDIIPAPLVAIFNEQELELLISGLPEIDVDDWKSNTEYHNYSASSPQIQWFWRAVRSYDKEERAKLLQFVTGTSKVPLNGFKELEGMNGFSRFNIHRDYGNKDRLPSSHTCFNQLDLPEYESYEALRQQVLTAITAGSEYFGFA